MTIEEYRWRPFNTRWPWGRSSASFYASRSWALRYRARMRPMPTVRGQRTYRARKVALPLRSAYRPFRLPNGGYSRVVMATVIMARTRWVGRRLGGYQPSIFTAEDRIPH